MAVYKFLDTDVVIWDCLNDATDFHSDMVNFSRETRWLLAAKFILKLQTFDDTGLKVNLVNGSTENLTNFQSSDGCKILQYHLPSFSLSTNPQDFFSVFTASYVDAVKLKLLLDAPLQ